MERAGGPEEELDDVLEGRAGEYADELEPMVGAARLLQEALTAHDLRPEVAARHIELALHGPRRRRARTRPLWRVAAAALLAAVLSAGLTTVASASALPGQMLYPAKRVVERVRLAAATSPDGKAEVRLEIAATRLTELRALTGRHEPDELLDTINAMRSAVRDANVAVTRADRQHSPEAPDLWARWRTVRREMVTELEAVIAGPPASSAAQAESVRSTAASVLKSWGVPVPPSRGGGPGGGPPPASAPVRGVPGESSTTTSTTSPATTSAPTTVASSSSTTSASTSTTTKLPTTTSTTSTTTTSTSTTVPPTSSTSTPTTEAPTSTTEAPTSSTTPPATSTTSTTVAAAP